MTWLWLVPLVPLALIALLAITEIAADWLHACGKLVAPWHDKRPCKNKTRKRVWFP